MTDDGMSTRMGRITQNLVGQTLGAQMLDHRNTTRTSVAARPGSEGDVTFGKPVVGDHEASKASREMSTDRGEARYQQVATK